MFVRLPYGLLTRAFSTTAPDSSANASVISPGAISDDFVHIAYIHTLWLMPSDNESVIKYFQLKQKLYETVTDYFLITCFSVMRTE